MVLRGVASLFAARARRCCGAARGSRSGAVSRRTAGRRCPSVIADREMTIARRGLTVELVGDACGASVGDDQPPVITVSAARNHPPERSLLGATYQQDPTFHASDARQTTGGGPISLAPRMAPVIAKAWATQCAQRVAHTGASRMARPTAPSRATTLATTMTAVRATARAPNGALAVCREVDLVRGRLDRRVDVRDDGEHGSTVIVTD